MNAKSTHTLVMCAATLLFFDSSKSADLPFIEGLEHREELSSIGIKPGGTFVLSVSRMTHSQI